LYLAVLHLVEEFALAGATLDDVRTGLLGRDESRVITN
jgi:hypothetical protein